MHNPVPLYSPKLFLKFSKNVIGSDIYKHCFEISSRKLQKSVVGEIEQIDLGAMDDKHLSSLKNLKHFERFCFIRCVVTENMKNRMLDMNECIDGFIIN